MHTWVVVYPLSRSDLVRSCLEEKAKRCDLNAYTDKYNFFVHFQTLTNTSKDNCSNLKMNCRHVLASNWEQVRGPCCWRKSDREGSASFLKLCWHWNDSKRHLVMVTLLSPCAAQLRLQKRASDRLGWTACGLRQKAHAGPGYWATFLFSLHGLRFSFIFIQTCNDLVCIFQWWFLSFLQNGLIFRACCHQQLHRRLPWTFAVDLGLFCGLCWCVATWLVPPSCWLLAFLLTPFDFC